MQQCVDPHYNYKCVIVNQWTTWYCIFCSASTKLSEITRISIFRVEIQKLSTNLKVKEEVSSATLVPTYQITMRHIPDSHNSGIHRCHKQKWGNFVRITSIFVCYLY